MKDALTLAQSEWNKALVTGSVQMLDATRGVWTCAVLVNGKAQPALHWGPVRMILTDEIIKKLAAWNEGQQGETYAE